ncbi:hypothetical protein KKH27_02385 [bacterium]|nr:hypothetical protein [bacterium]MBU1984661.1 hypothetical protein [bacterium]
MKRLIAVVAALAVIVMIVGGCASPEQRAQKLFDEGKYQEVLDKYADQPIAKQAREGLAAKMVTEGKFQEVIDNFGDTPAAQDAKNKRAEQLLAEKKYDEILQKFPNTPSANVARSAVAEGLYAEKKIDELVMKYPNTPAGVKARNELAKEEFDKLMKKPKKDRKKLYEEFLKNPKYAGTESAMAAQKELAGAPK